MLDKLLHFGSGSRDLRPGWINIDSNIKTETRPDGAICLQHDLRERLPFADNEFSLIYSSHFLEHLTTDEGIGVMRECFRVLKPGGRFRNSLPDARMAIMAYVSETVTGDQTFFRQADKLVGESFLPSQPYRSTIDYINRAARGWNHQCLYDPRKLVTMLSFVGFVNCSQVSFDPSVDNGAEVRKLYSFYVDAFKP